MIARMLFAVSLLIGAPAMAQVYKCPDASGRTVFQQVPCDGGKKLDVQPARGNAMPRTAETPETAADSAPAAKPITNAERIEAKTQASIRERHRRELEQRTVPRARAAIYQHRDQCTRTMQALRDDEFAYKLNLYGKTHAAQRASEQAAVSAECDTRDRALVTQFQQLLAECVALDGCAGVRP